MSVLVCVSLCACGGTQVSPWGTPHWDLRGGSSPLPHTCPHELQTGVLYSCFQTPCLLCFILWGT